MKRPASRLADAVRAASPAATLALAARVDTITIGEGLVLLEPRTGAALALNASAALIATSFDGRRSTREVALALADETGVDAELLLHDVVEAAATLLDHGVLRVLHDGRDRPLDRSVRVGELTINVQCDDATAAQPLCSLLDAFPGSGGDGFAAPVPDAVLELRRHAGRFALLEDGRGRDDLETVEAAVHQLLFRFNELVVDGSDGTVRLHAGAVERDGRAVLLVGDSGRGKSTLTAALVQRGWGYLTDEVAILDPASWSVTPYPRALDLSADACHRLGLPGADVDLGAHKGKVLPTTLGRVAAPGAKLAQVVFVGAPDQLGTAPERLVRLLGCVFAPTLDDDGVLEALANLCETAPMLVLERGPLNQMVAVVEAAVGRASAAPALS